ncbi:hypothetical protein [Lacipirellula limnantheis]|nr:hypothetical protein [Lacipirellula limnantheis]
MSNLLRDNSDDATGVRFRLPALLAAMSLLALLAALAGPYFRRQSLEVQQSLAAYWTLTLVIGASSFVRRWRAMMTPNPLMGCAHWRVTLLRRRPWRDVAVRVGALALILLWLSSGTRHVTMLSDRFASGTTLQWLGVAARGIVMGVILGYGLLPLLLKRSAFLCERGVWSLRREVVWSKLSAWRWETDRPGVLRLTERLAPRGDLLLAVPAELRDAVEAFIREKTELTIPDPKARVAVVQEADDGEGEAV